MSLAGLLGHKQNPEQGTLKEILTLLSDCSTIEKQQAIKDYIFTGGVTMKPKYYSKTYNYLNQNMKYIGLGFNDKEEE